MTLIACALHGQLYEDDCAGCEEAEYWNILGIVTERMANDTDELLTLEELAEHLGIDLDELGRDLDEGGG